MDGRRLAMTKISFEETKKKGEYAEKIVKQMLEAKGYVVYMPLTKGAHAFDIMAIKNKKTCIALDIKAKARLNKYPATGVDIRHYETYKEFSKKHNIPFWIVFVDEMEKKIYGNSIDLLDAEYVDHESPKMEKYPFRLLTKKNEDLILWHLNQMKEIAILPDNHANTLAGMNHRSYDYRPEL